MMLACEDEPAKPVLYTAKSAVQLAEVLVKVAAGKLPRPTQPATIAFVVLAPVLSEAVHSLPRVRTDSGFRKFRQKFGLP